MTHVSCIYLKSKIIFFKPAANLKARSYDLTFIQKRESRFQSCFYVKVTPKSQGGAQKHPPFKASMKAAKLHHHHRRGKHDPDRNPAWAKIPTK